MINKCEDLLCVDYTREDLLHCYNIIEQDLALNYDPLYETHRCDTKVIYFTDLKYKPARIISCNGKFKIYPTYIESEENIKEVIYSYIPNTKKLTDDSSYNSSVLNCLAYGIMAEFMLLHGFYEEAMPWHNRYQQEIKMLMI